ncbi:hypothetical protein [Arsenophonus endosymbiont of Aleurodicus floccissimus]|uniref:hypothetical protein n=1 Tax=Arsenophonus endosymbiont of Aleurodicus floccissimus TaxID=2152761 RepID=UPI003F726A2F
MGGWGGNRHSIMPDKKTDNQPPNSIHAHQSTQDVNNKLLKDDYDDELPQNAKDNELPQEDYDNEVTSIPNNCITSPWRCNNTNTCYWATPTSCYSSTPMFYYPMMNNFNGDSYDYSSPWQYSITYNATLPNQPADCNNYGYCNQQQATF